MAGRSPRSQATMMVGIRVKGTWAGAHHMWAYWAKIDIIINISTKTTLIPALMIIICIIILRQHHIGQNPQWNEYQV